MPEGRNVRLDHRCLLAVEAQLKSPTHGVKQSLVVRHIDIGLAFRPAFVNLISTIGDVLWLSN